MHILATALESNKKMQDKIIADMKKIFDYINELHISNKAIKNEGN